MAKSGKLLSQLSKLQGKLGVGSGQSFVGRDWRKDWKKAKKYMGVYDKAAAQGADLTGYGTFDIANKSAADEGFYNPYQSGSFGGDGFTQTDTGPTRTDQGGTPASPPPMPDPNGDGENPATSPYPHGPGVDDVVASLTSGNMPFNINTTQGAKAAEVMFPYVKQLYDVEMDKHAIESGARSIEDYKDDPVLNKASEMTMSLMNNPYTFDDETVNLMQNRVRDQTATSEAAMGDRLRSMGVTLGTDSPAYANLASQASLVRDINRAQMERDLDIKMAGQRMQDRYRAAGAGGQFGGAYQAGLAGRYQGLAGIQQRRSYGQMANPFAGLWQGMMMEDEMNQDPSFMQQYGGAVSGLIGAGGSMGASALYNPYDN